MGTAHVTSVCLRITCCLRSSNAAAGMEEKDFGHEANYWRSIENRKACNSTGEADMTSLMFEGGNTTTGNATTGNTTTPKRAYGCRPKLPKACCRSVCSLLLRVSQTKIPVFIAFIIASFVCGHFLWTGSKGMTGRLQTRRWTIRNVHSKEKALFALVRYKHCIDSTAFTSTNSTVHVFLIDIMP